MLRRLFVKHSTKEKDLDLISDGTALWVRINVSTLNAVCHVSNYLFRIRIREANYLQIRPNPDPSRTFLKPLKNIWSNM
jgi:hypothetical protein